MNNFSSRLSQIYSCLKRYFHTEISKELINLLMRERLCNDAMNTYLSVNILRYFKFTVDDLLFMVFIFPFCHSMCATNDNLKLLF